MENIAIDTSKTYLLSNTFSGTGRVLAAPNTSAAGSAPVMVNTTNATDSNAWFLTRVGGNQPGVFFRVHAASLGSGQSLDVVNNGGAVTATQLMMATSGDSSGQAWRFDRWSDKESDGFRLSNKLTGPDVHLDVTGDNMIARLVGGAFLGQHWFLDAAGGASGASNSHTTSLSPLSTGVIAGLTVAIVLGLGLLISGGLFWFIRWRNRKNRSPSAENKNVELGLERKGSFQSSEASQRGNKLMLVQTTTTVSHQEGELIPNSAFQPQNHGITKSSVQTLARKKSTRIIRLVLLLVQRGGGTLLMTPA